MDCRKKAVACLTKAAGLLFAASTILLISACSSKDQSSSTGYITPYGNDDSSNYEKKNGESDQPETELLEQAKNAYDQGQIS